MFLHRLIVQEEHCGFNLKCWYSVCSVASVVDKCSVPMNYTDQTIEALHILLVEDDIEVAKEKLYEVLM